MPHNSYYHRMHLILNIIHHLGPISRTELVELTDYRPASVGDIINELLDRKLILQTGRSSGGHGRKRTLLEINKDHLYAIGISFSPNSVLCLCTGIDGRIFSQRHLPIAPGLPKQALAGQITRLVESLLVQYTEKELVGIGICRPFYDPLSYETSHTLQTNYTQFHSWIHQTLKPMLEKCCSANVETFSPVTLPALAEQQFGVAKGAQNFICVELSNGIGASLFCNGVAVGGADGMAGELGHTVIEHSGNAPLCYCGKPGCVESSSAYPALAANISQALDSGVFSELSPTHKTRGFTVQDIRKALDAGDRMCMHFVKETAQRLGVAIANAANLLNPELIVLYGFMLELGDYFLQQLETAIRENTMPLANHFPIRVSASLETILPLGAAAELFAAYLKSDNHKWVYQLER